MASLHYRRRIECCSVKYGLFHGEMYIYIYIYMNTLSILDKSIISNLKKNPISSISLLPSKVTSK